MVGSGPDTRIGEQTLSAPFPWFGGKRTVAQIVWPVFGNPPHYIEPFFGSGAMLLGRPHHPGLETVNDFDGFVANAWRAIQAAPDEVAYWADQPVIENDLHARHIWLVQRKSHLQSQLEGNIDFFDARTAGYWIWGISVWIGGDFASGKGPWQINSESRLVKTAHGDKGQGITRQRPHLSNNGQGIKKSSERDHIRDWMRDLAKRLRHVRVACGDWTRVTGPSIISHQSPTAVFLDPPYSTETGRDPNIYTVETDVSTAVRKWAIEHGENPNLRIALCGYEGEHDMPDTWRVLSWRAGGGYGNRGGCNTNRGRERIWLSPACLNLDSQQIEMF